MLVSAVGFKLRSKVRLFLCFMTVTVLTDFAQDDSNSHFTLFEFVKTSRTSKTEQEWEKLMERGSVLKPCEYKRR